KTTARTSFVLDLCFLDLLLISNSISQANFWLSPQNKILYYPTKTFSRKSLKIIGCFAQLRVGKLTQISLAPCRTNFGRADCAKSVQLRFYFEASCDCEGNQEVGCRHPTS